MFNKVIDLSNKQRDGKKVFNVKLDTAVFKSLPISHIAQDHSRTDASSVAIVIIDIGSSGVDPGSFPCILARYRFVGTSFRSHTDLYHNQYDSVKN